MPHSLTYEDLQEIADVLAESFESVLSFVEAQIKVGDDLKTRFERTFERYDHLPRSYDSSSGEISDWRNEITKQIGTEEPSTGALSSVPDIDESVRKAQAAIQRLSASKMPGPTKVRTCPVTFKVTDQEDFEHDFTTQGRIGDLGCPFAGAKDGSGECGPDPIAEEFHGEKVSAVSKASAQTGSRCPIRFLDKHSPEEIAQYFENHKHEIPRSHEICVKRYRQNEQSIRQLDAKYGNLVNMIQGLGNKHKPYLPEDEKVADESERQSAKAVEKWAEDVSQQSLTAEETERAPHFERPLRDIRVGESPSRPWGISVPADKSPAPSAVPSIHHGSQPTKPDSMSPISLPTGPVVEEKHDQPKLESRIASPQPIPRPQVIFNGPVFFGYSAEQAALFLQKMGAGSTVL